MSGSLGKKLLGAFAGAALSGIATIGVTTAVVEYNLANTEGCVEAMEELGRRGNSAFVDPVTNELTPLGQDAMWCMEQSGAFAGSLALPFMVLAGGIGGWAVMGRRSSAPQLPGPGA